MNTASMRAQWSEHPLIQVIKPGIVSGNAISVLGGYFLAARGAIHWLDLMLALLGTSLVIASGCTINNIIDRDIDAKMVRTQNRVLVTGRLPMTAAFLYAAVLLVLGLVCLAKLGALALQAALFGYAVYVGLYSLFFKRHSVWGTIIGSFSGAIPPVIGYAAVVKTPDTAFWLLFLMFSIWQWPHAWAIAVFRNQDYRNADLPVLPLKVSTASTQRHMLMSIGMYALAGSFLTWLGYTGYVYLLVLLAGTAFWMYLAASPRAHQPELSASWARKVFGWSIVMVMATCLAMALDWAR